MKDISKYVSKAIGEDHNYEFIWDEIRYKVILFVDGDPVSYVALGDNENTMNGALKAASVLLNGKGINLKNNS